MTVERNNMATVKAAAATAVYVEDVFSTYLYTGTGATRSITNNIDLSTNGGMVWIKVRDQFENHDLFDTVRGATKFVYANAAAGQQTVADTLTAFNTNGFSLGADAGGAGVNYSGWNFASWTFRKQAKFFDVVSYTGTGSARTIAHSLGSTPGMIIVKRTDTTANWRVYHSGLTSASYYLALNTTAAQALDTTIWNATAPTSSVFSVGTDATVNASGGTYIAYIYASNAGGFGSAGTDNVITCGSYTGNGSTTGPSVSLGYEPQYIFIRRIDSAGAWNCGDNMRGVSTGSSDNWFEINTSSPEYAQNNLSFTATGFQLTSTTAEFNASGGTYIYMAIRRGPMKTPTSGTSVYEPKLRAGNNTNGALVTASITPDIMIPFDRTSAIGAEWTDRLRGNKLILYSYSSTSELTGPGIVGVVWDQTTGNQNGYYVSSTGQANSNYSGDNYVDYLFSRAPGFFDVVCYTGTGSATTITHNLGVAPELIIVKRRDATGAWPVYSSQLTNNAYYAVLNTTAAQASGSTYWNSTTPTNTVFSIGTAADVNTSTGTYVAYLFASCAGVSKVGSYTGTAAALNIDCGFAAGARFVMIKRTDSTGGWYVWDSARGISASGTNDPYLLFNSSAAEVTNTDYLATYSPGFALTSSGSTTTNVSGGTYIYLAIA